MAITKTEILEMLEVYKAEVATNLTDVMTDGDISVQVDKMKLNQALAASWRIVQLKAWVEDNL